MLFGLQEELSSIQPAKYQRAQDSGDNEEPEESRHLAKRLLPR